MAYDGKRCRYASRIASFSGHGHSRCAARLVVLIRYLIICTRCEYIAVQCYLHFRFHPVVASHIRIGSSVRERDNRSVKALLRNRVFHGAGSRIISDTGNHRCRCSCIDIVAVCNGKIASLCQLTYLNLCSILICHKNSRLLFRSVIRKAVRNHFYRNQVGAG